MLDAKKIGNRLREAREDKHLSQRELARCIGIDAANICRYENAKQSPKDKTKEKLATALNKTVSQLFYF